jgi:hypothetical protein
LEERDEAALYVVGEGGLWEDDGRAGLVSEEAGPRVVRFDLVSEEAGPRVVRFDHRLPPP